jgi:hypothetical protein
MLRTLKKIVLRHPTVLSFNHNPQPGEGEAGATASTSGFDCCGAEEDRSPDTYDNLVHDNLVHEKLEPLQAFLVLNAAELKNIVLRLPQELGYNYNHDNLVTKLRLQQEHLPPWHDDRVLQRCVGCRPASVWRRAH